LADPTLWDVPVIRKQKTKRPLEVILSPPCVHILYDASPLQHRGRKARHLLPVVNENGQDKGRPFERLKHAFSISIALKDRFPKFALPPQNDTISNRMSHRARLQRLVCQDITLLRGSDGYFQCTLCPKRDNDYAAMQNHLRRDHHSLPGGKANPSKSTRQAPYPAPTIDGRISDQSTSARSIRGSASQNPPASLPQAVSLGSLSTMNLTL
jgi:hypothetical protein